MVTATKNKKNSHSKLTADNYYHEQSYMDVSSFKPFLNCEAAGLASYQGKYQMFNDDTPLLVGNYIHSHFESKEAHQKFLNKDKKKLFRYGNPDKGLKKEYQQADTMIKCLASEPLFQNLYIPGDKEVIVTGDLHGYQWKGKVDSLNLERGYFCDLKTVDNFHKKHWNKKYNYPVNFAVDRGYFYQIALYRELIHQQFGKWCVPFICAVSKQDPPDKDIFDFDADNAQQLLDESLQTLIDRQEQVFKVINGELKPTRCESCDWCRMTKHLTGSTGILDIQLDS